MNLSHGCKGVVGDSKLMAWFNRNLFLSLIFPRSRSLDYKSQALTLLFTILFFFLNCLDCDFTCTSSEVPVVDFSKAGSLQFEGDPERCLSGLVVAQWSYRLNTPQKNTGKPNNFIIKARLSNRWSLQVRKQKYCNLKKRFHQELYTALQTVPLVT